MSDHTHEDPDDLDALLCAALDGTDPRRAAMLLQMALLRHDTDREADLDRLRREGPPQEITTF